MELPGRALCERLPNVMSFPNAIPSVVVAVPADGSKEPGDANAGTEQHAAMAINANVFFIFCE